MLARTPGRVAAGNQAAAEGRLLARGVALALASVFGAGAVAAYLERRGWIGHDLGYGVEALLACLLLTALGFSFVFLPLRAGARSREEKLRAALLAERSLRGELDRLGAASPVGIAFLDAGGRVLRANPTLATILGEEGNALAGRSLGELFPGRDLSPLFPTDGNAPESGRVEVDLRAGDAARCVVVDVLRFGGPEARDGCPALLRVADVTEARVQTRAVELARRAAMTSEERFRAVFEQAAVGMCECDLEGRFRRVNGRLCEITGYSEEELLDRTFREISLPEDLEAEVPMLERVLRGEDADFEMEKRYLRKDGSTVWGCLSVSLLRDDSGTPTGIIGVVQDIAARRDAEAALERERSSFRALLDTSAMLVWKCDASGACDYFNRTWLDFTGRSEAEEAGDGWAAGVHPDDLPGCLDVFRGSLATGAPFQMEYRLRRHDGVYRWLLDAGVPIRGADGSLQGFLGSCVDITAMHEASDRLRALSHRLVNVQEEERRLLARELHDGLGQTLTGLAYGLRWCAQRCPDGQGEVGQRLNEMLRELEGAILEVRDLSRRLRPASLDLGLVAALETEVAAFRRRTGVPCEFEAPEERVQLDSGRALSLFRVVQEALVNVARHARASRIAVRVSHGDGMVRLEVADDGRGFDEAALGSPDAFGLTGLRERLAPYGGRFRVERNEPRGTRVVAELPAGRPTPVPAGRPA